MSFYDLFSDLCKRKGVKPSRAATELGINRSNVTNWKNGGYTPRGDTLQRIADYFGVTTDYLLTGEEKEKSPAEIGGGINLPSNLMPVPNFVKRPRLGAIACGKPILAIEDAEEFDDVPEHIECNFTLLCKGDSMINARIFDGDIVYIRQQPEVENGEIAAVRIGDEATLKRVYYSGDRLILRAANPLYEDMEFDGTELENVEIMGKAVAFTSLIR